ncbi:MAG: histidinol dehydrogenase [Candidatus Dormibacteria bacterium]
MSQPAVTVDIQAIVDDVRTRGDAAVAQWAERFDGVAPARALPGPGLPVEAVLAAADAVRRWHAAQRPQDLTLEVLPGVRLERRWVPLQTVGVYVPRRLVSSLIMAAVPAQVAGVERIVVCTPPAGAELVAAAAELLGVSEVWAVGGAQAIAAMAYGTESIPRVDKIVGPGSGAVNRAKLAVSAHVAIDLPAGPSEVVVAADRGIDRAIIDSELRAQCEHGPDSSGTVVEVGDDLESALAQIDARAPEHVALLGPRAESLARRIRNAGAVFVGHYSPVPAGDYATGANHILPTGGWARSSGGMGLETFLKAVTVQRITQAGLESIRPTIECLAELEGMHLHAAAIRR